MRARSPNRTHRHGISQWRPWLLLSATLAVLAATGADAALPKRLVILLDGVAHRDVAALQAGLSETNGDGRVVIRHAFTNGWFPASRLVSTFPSASDVAWTEILGNAPLPGYQRTYYHHALGREIFQNGVTSTIEYEHQMHWQLESGFQRAIGYLHPHTIFKNEVREMIVAFRASRDGGQIFYGLLRASDDAQHTRGDILELLRFLDGELSKLREEYRAGEGSELELLVLSDHGNNHAGAGTRSPVRTFLRDAGYSVGRTIRSRRDVVLPTVGIQNWIEVHCAPEETAALAETLARLDGADIVTARAGERAASVINAGRGRAVVEWRGDMEAFRYEARNGDPLGYAPVIEAMRSRGELDGDGFATAAAWEAATLDHHYPLAPERIARGHATLAQNAAPILVSLGNGWIHASWMLEKLSMPMKMGGTHGALDALCSNGVLLSSFIETRDTATARVAAQVGGFGGLREYRAGTTGAEWVSSETAIRTTASNRPAAPQENHAGGWPSLLVWSPVLKETNTAQEPMTVTLRPLPKHPPPAGIRRADLKAPETPIQTIALTGPWRSKAGRDYERVYDLSGGLQLKPFTAYRLSGRLGKGASGTFELNFQTGAQGIPVIE